MFSKLPADIRKGFLTSADDLSQLKLINAGAVRKLAEEINRLTSSEIGERKLVVMLAAGGTIAMKTREGIRLPALAFDDLLGLANSRLQHHFKVVGLDAFNLDSSQMNYSHTRELAVVLAYLWNNIKLPFLGFVVTHGTDTLSYSSAAISLMMGQGLPFSIVYTGSQRPPEEPMSDIGVNFRNALFTLEALHDNDMAEVLVVMGDRAMLATSAEKVDDTGANAFDSLRHRYVANFSRLQYPIQVADWLNPRRRAPFAPTIWPGDYSHTLVVKSTLGLNPQIIRQQAEMPEIRSIILYSYGTGTLDEAMLNVVMPVAEKRQIPVFVVNPVNSDYEVNYQSSARAVQMGAVPLNMTLSAALAKTEIALRLHPDDKQAMARFMTSNYVGEIPSPSSRFAPVR